MKHLRLLLLSLALAVTTSAPALASYDSATSDPGAAIADAVLVRPVMLDVSLVGTALYLGTLPLTFLTNVDEEAGCALIRAPWRFTSGRDRGAFHAYEHPQVAGDHYTTSVAARPPPAVTPSRGASEPVRPAASKSGCGEREIMVICT